MATNKQSQAIANVARIVDAAQRLIQLALEIEALSNAYSDQGSATVLANMQTAPVKADGTVDTANPDATVVTTNPIVALPRSLSSFQISQLLTTIQGWQNYVAGQALSANAGARAILNAASGG